MAEPGANGSTAPKLSWLTFSLFLVGLIAKVAPFANQGGRLFRQFPTEDGYLMLTIARNLALGHGMSTADGTMPTNGTQPLATFLWALCAFVVGSDKGATIVAVLVVELAIATATAYGIYRTALGVLAPTPAARSCAMLAAAAWFASMSVIIHSMNCLESGLYVLVLVLVLLQVFRPRTSRANPDLRHWVALGVTLGVAFWARNDAVLVCASIAVVHLGWGLPYAPPRVAQRFAELAVAGSLVVFIAAPWLLFNYTQFGHIMPISGQSEAMDVRFGMNVRAVIPATFAYATMFLPIPSGYINQSWALVAGGAALVGYVGVTWRSARESDYEPTRKAWLLAAVMTLAFSLFYGLFFGAPHFMSRYFLALSPLYAIAWGAIARALAQRMHERSKALFFVAAVALVALAAGANLRTYLRGTSHPHFEVADWVRKHVPDSAWVGSPQSGTIGYFHDRTINFDGKVNPYALEARLQGRISQYVVDSEVGYVADWAWTAGTVAIPPPGLVLTMADPIIAGAFAVAHADLERNVGVLKRRSR